MFGGFVCTKGVPPLSSAPPGRGGRTTSFALKDMADVAVVLAVLGGGPTRN
jgi:hypothetical protein